MRVFVTRELPVAALEPLRREADVEVWPGAGPPPREALALGLSHADGLLCLLTDRIDGALLAAAPRLRVVSQMAVGVDNIDLAACARRGIVVGNTPGVLTDTTADLAFALLMAAARRLGEAERDLRAGSWGAWSPMLYAGADVHGATLGIVGMGRIGYQVARRGRGFDMPVLYVARRPHVEAERELGARRVELGELLRHSDFVSLHCPLTPETRGLIGAGELAAMKPGAILVNAARGPVVDQHALYEALLRGRPAAAGLDVYDVEPLPMDDPLLTLPNVVLAPHIGSASVATRTQMAQMAAANLLAGLRGEPLPNPVPNP